MKIAALLLADIQQYMNENKSTIANLN